MYNYVNKLFICFLCLVAVIYSCRAKKESVEKLHVANQDQSRIETNTSWMRFGIRDSTLRYWSFTSDTSFYFNPDEGVVGSVRKGRLYGTKIHRNKERQIAYSVRQPRIIK